jgi:hypothetical protein
MRKVFTIAVVLMMAAALQTQAQILTPVHWSYAAKKISKDEAVVFMKATMDEGWHVYSQTVKDGGPVKTTEPTPVTKYEKVFSMDVSYFEHEVIFQQKIKLKAGQVTVKGTLEYMTCNDHQCLPPEDVEFSIAVK